MYIHLHMKVGREIDCGRSPDGRSISRSKRKRDGLAGCKSQHRPPSRARCLASRLYGEHVILEPV